MHKIVINEEGINSLIFDATTLRDAGLYTCIAQNRAGEDRFQVRLNVNSQSLLSSFLFYFVFLLILSFLFITFFTFFYEKRKKSCEAVAIIRTERLKTENGWLVARRVSEHSDKNLMTMFT